MCYGEMATYSGAYYQLFGRNNIRSLAVPIMNPYFYKFPCDNMIVLL